MREEVPVVLPGHDRCLNLNKQITLLV